MTSRTVAFLCALMSLALAAVVYVAVLWYTEGQLARNAQLRLSLLTDTLRTNIDRSRGIPSLVGASTYVQALLRQSGDEEIRADANAFLAKTAWDNDIDGLFILDHDGIAVASGNFTEPGSYVGENYGFRPYFQSAKVDGLASYYGVGVTTGRPGYFLASRVVFGPGEADFGVVVVKTNFAKLEASWAEGGEQVLVSDAEGVVLLSNNPRFRYRPIKQLSRKVVDTLDAERRYGGNVIGAAIELLRDLPKGAIASQEVPGTSWQIMTVLPRHARGWQPVTAAVAVLLFGIVVTMTIIASNQRRTRRLADIQAKRDLERRVEERTIELVDAMERLEEEIVERRNSDAKLLKARDELVQAAKLAAMGQAFAGLAHEVNQPLAALKTYLSSTRLLISRGETTSATENVGIMNETVERLARLTSDLKHLSRRSDDGVAEVDLAETAWRMVELMKFHVRDAGATVNETHEDAVTVVANQARIEQIVLNLLKNAVDVCGQAERKEIDVVTCIRDGMACLSVGDFGPGVPDHARARLFEPFFTTKEVGKGLGLGLAISYTIARDHGGALRYERTQQGQTWFHLVLPLKTPVAEQESET